VNRNKLAEIIKEAASIKVVDYLGCCNELRAAAIVWLRAFDDGEIPREVSVRLRVANKTAMVKDDVCKCNLRTELCQIIADNDDLL
jgi:hypothetical protein